jgi:Ras-related protein Rab-1A
MSSDSVETFKVLVIGDSGVGKSSILTRFVDKRWDPVHIATIGVDYYVKTMKWPCPEGDTVKLQMWDTAGAERFRSLTRNYYRYCSGVVIVFDLTSEESFRNTRHWLIDVDSYCPSGVAKILVGNKVDLRDERVVSRERAMEYAAGNNMIYMETSSRLTHQTHEASRVFEKMVDQLMLARIPKTKLEQISEKRPESIILAPKHKLQGDCCP